MLSEIDKNKASLYEAQRYKEFLLTIDLEFASKMAQEKALRKEQLKQDWIRKMKNIAPNTDMFRIIFTDDEMIHGDIKLQVTAARTTQTKQSTVRGGPRGGSAPVSTVQSQMS